MENSNSKKSKLTSAIAVALAAVMLIGGASYAYLEDSDGDIVNNFSTNKVEVDIDETTGEDYDIVPGTSQDKDPSVTIDNTVDSYLYVVVTDNTQGLVEYEIADG
ncbi:MAG: CalY family protein [Clostridiales bacterium]|nr:CalY family protein [Clostridiales bacterium]